MGAVWVGGVIKVVGREGLVKLNDFQFAYNKIFDKIWKWVYRLKFRKNRMFLRFLAENQFLPILCEYF